jgi:acetylornithine deacetylase/succinyl-diaminopimelate desuccinylase-like protein
MSSSPLPLARLTPYVDEARERIVDTLFDWLRIPSISAHPDRAGDVQRSAEFAAALLGDCGLEHVTIVPTAGRPAVYGDWLHAGPDAPTVVVYGHHDVQPADPLELWDSPPFEPEIRGGECFARGAIDDKGQVLYQAEAVRGLLARERSLPVNVKFLVEGEEEVGSPNFESLLVGERDRLACDLIVVSDTGMLSPEIPSTCVAMRGLVGMHVRLRSARGDLHSGMFGGAVPNAALVAAELAAALHDADGRVTLPGFYDAVRPLSDAEQASLDAVPFDEAAWMEQAGVTATAGEAGRTVLERIGSRPTAEVVGISGGYAGPGVKTIVPATAHLVVALRLVADQDPAAVIASFRQWVADHLPPGVVAEVESEGGGVAPARTPVEHPAVGALSRVISRIWGVPPLFTREGGSGPEEALGRVLDAPLLFLGVGLPGDRIHAPNERMVMDQFWKGLLAAGELWPELATAVA